MILGKHLKELKLNVDMAIDKAMNEKTVELGRGYINGGFASNTAIEKV